MLECLFLSPTFPTSLVFESMKRTYSSVAPNWLGLEVVWIDKHTNLLMAVINNFITQAPPVFFVTEMNLIEFETVLKSICLNFV